MAERDAERENRRRAANGDKRRVEPLFTQIDADETLRLFEVHPYGRPIDVLPGVVATYRDAGHILGSASVAHAEQARRPGVLFSDIGQYDSPILRDPDARRGRRGADREHLRQSPPS